MTKAGSRRAKDLRALSQTGNSTSSTEPQRITTHDKNKTVGRTMKSTRSSTPTKRSNNKHYNRHNGNQETRGQQEMRTPKKRAPCAHAVTPTPSKKIKDNNWYNNVVTLTPYYSGSLLKSPPPPPTHAGVADDVSPLCDKTLQTSNQQTAASIDSVSTPPNKKSSSTRDDQKIEAFNFLEHRSTLTTKYLAKAMQYSSAREAKRVVDNQNQVKKKNLKQLQRHIIKQHKLMHDASAIIVELMEDQETKLSDVAPIPCLPKAAKMTLTQSRQEATREMERMGVYLGHNTKPSPTQIIEDIQRDYDDQEERHGEDGASWSSPPFKPQQLQLQPIRAKKSNKNKATTNKQNGSDPPVACAPPSSGHQWYTPYQAASILCQIESAFEKSHGKRAARIKRSEQERYFRESNLVPPEVSTRTLNNHRKSFLSGTMKRNQPWGYKGGKVRLISDEEFQSEIDSLLTVSGCSIGRKEVEEILVQYKTKQLRSKGLCPAGPVYVDPTTVATYLALAASYKGNSVAKSFRHKTNTRHAAESSSRCGASLMATVGSSHYVPVSSVRLSDHNAILKGKASEGAKRFYKTVLGVHGDLPIRAIRPHYILTTDDIAKFVYVPSTSNKVDESEAFRLIKSKSLEKASTHSKYDTKEMHIADGIRVKLSHTFSLAGLSAQIFVTVSGLSERELPGEQPLLLVPIAGLTIGGAGCTVGDKREGFVLFMRAEKGADEQRYRIYRDKVLFPFVDELRKEFDKWDGKSPIDPELHRVVSWQDGDISQIANIVDDVESYRAKAIDAEKHNAARTAVEQAADLCPVFRTLHGLFDNMKTFHSQLNSTRITKVMEELHQNGKLHLPYRKQKALVYLLSCIPKAYSKAITEDGIRSGGLKNGMLDWGEKKFPCIDGMLSTLSRELCNEERQQILDNLPLLIKEHLAHGHIREGIFDVLNFPKDRKSDGEELLRQATITQEHLQRSKTLTHSFQVEERQRIVTESALEAQRRRSLVLDRQRATLRGSDECEVMLDNLGITTKAEEDFTSWPNTENVRKLPGKKYLVAFLEARGIPVKATMKKAELAKIVLNNRETPKTLTTTPVSPEDQAVQQSHIQTQVEIIPMSITGAAIEDATTQTRRSTNTLAPWPATTLTYTLSRVNIPVRDFLQDETWVRRVQCLLKIDGRAAAGGSESLGGEGIDGERSTSISNAEVLTRVCRQRLHRHLCLRLGNEYENHRPQHWCWDFAYANMPAMCSIMVLQGHVKSDLVAVSQNPMSCLLQGEEKFESVSMGDTKDRKKNYHGAYLYYDKNDRKFVRSGKVAGRHFADRHEDHSKSASKQDGVILCGSTFYQSYPSESRKAEVSNGGRRGWFESLEMKVAFGMPAFEECEECVFQTRLEGGIFIFDDSVKSAIRRAKFRGIPDSTDEGSNQKFIHLFAYLAELVYDLCISTSDNVSENPGFESFCSNFQS